MTDKALFMRAQAGDERAFTALFQRYSARLYVYFYGRVGEDPGRAEDLRQQVFLRLVQSDTFCQPPYTGPDSLQPFLFTIARNLLKNEYRGRDRRMQREVAYGARLETTTPAPNLEDERTTDRQWLRAAIQQLPPAQRICVDLRFLQSYSIEQIAAAVDAPAGTVKSRLHYGLKTLAKLLKTHSV